MKTNQSLLSSINIGILGLGTIGSAVAEVLQKTASAIEERTGVRLAVKKVCDLRKVKTSFPLVKNPDEVIDDPEISVIVETIGGTNPARELVLKALRAGKSVVTPNKELIALHLEELQKVAGLNRAVLLFEGAVGGGIPILNTLRDNLSANRIDEVFGIVNGTTNYILSKMTEEGRGFAAVLKEAQAKGFAEANPKNDLEGFDASYKAAILASIAFGAKVDWQEVYREGIEKISTEDIDYAKEIGYAIKLLAIAKRGKQGLDIRVHPALVAKSHPLASVSQNFNAIYVKGFPVGELMFYGPGAGGEPTASAIINDVITIVKNNFKCPISNIQLMKFQIKPIEEVVSRYYIRLQTPDRHGVLAGIAKAFADHQVSIAAVTQKEAGNDSATIVILTHEVSGKNLSSALADMSKPAIVKKVCNVIRIL